MQLVAYGAQDIYLTANPEHTLFKAVYVRITNFACESIEQTFNGNVALGKRVTAEISRNGDLIKDMWLECEFAADDSAVYGLGNALVKQAEIEIGGQLIDRQYGEWMNIWSELTVPAGKRVGYDEMVGNVALTKTNGTADRRDVKTQLDVPLQFWFNRNPGLALPLIALQYHQVKLNLDLESAANLTSTENSAATVDLTTCKLWVDYIFLDTDERRKFAQVSHEYLIEQVQFTGDETLSSTKRVDLSFNHPVKALYWVAQTSTQVRGASSNTGEPCQFTTLGETATGKVKLQLNGQDRFTERRNNYFLRVQPFKHHTSGPRANRALNLVVANVDSDPDTTDTAGSRDDVAVTENCSQFIYMYSFAQNPERHQPTGTCNMSRIDTATLILSGVPSGLTSTPGTLKVFALSYNVLRIMSGMGGVAYAS